MIDGAPHDLVFISVGLLFIYCVAAIVAPAIASVLMKDFGPQALFVQNAYVHLAIAALALWRLVVAPQAREPDATRRVTECAQSLTTVMSGAAGFFIPTT